MVIASETNYIMELSEAITAISETHWKHFKANNVSSTLKSVISYCIIELVELVACFYEQFCIQCICIHVNVIYSQALNKSMLNFNFLLFEITRTIPGVFFNNLFTNYLRMFLNIIKCILFGL